MTPELKAKWLEALRSGRYTQGFKALKSTDKLGFTAYCCLGVLADVMDPGLWEFNDGSESHDGYVWNWRGSGGGFSVETCERIGLSDGLQMALIHANDEAGLSFNEIAGIIERQL